MLVRSNPRSLAFSSRVREYHNTQSSSEEQLSEQGCIRDLLRANEHDESDEVVSVPQWKTDAFPEEIRCLAKD